VRFGLSRGGPQGAHSARPAGPRGYRGLGGFNTHPLQHFSTHFDRQESWVQHVGPRGSAGGSTDQQEVQQASTVVQQVALGSNDAALIVRGRSVGLDLDLAGRQQPLLRLGEGRRLDAVGLLHLGEDLCGA
jgi:hypothetical protein